MLVVSLISYRQARQGLADAAARELETAGRDASVFLESWLANRFMDLRIQSESGANTALLLQLSAQWQETGQDLSGYVGSYDWALTVDGPQRDLFTLVQTYSYIDDVLLIDTRGNILFTVLRDSDLGTNFWEGKLAGTHFARSARSSLDSGQERLSDLERYEPSGGRLTTFLTAPILDDLGEKIGLLALRVSVSDLVAPLTRQSDGIEASRSYHLV